MFSNLGSNIKKILIDAKDNLIQATKRAWDKIKKTISIFLKRTLYGAYNGLIRGAHDGYLQYKLDMGYLLGEDAVWHTDIFIKEQQTEEEL